MNNLFTYVMFVMQNTNSWVTEDSWRCLNATANKYFTNDTLVMISDTQLNTLDLGYKDKYITSQNVPYRHENYDVILISRNITNWSGSIHGKIILLTESLEGVSSLWKRFKIVDLIVIHQNDNKCRIYGWFPYKKETCGFVELELLDVWEDGKFVKNSDLLVNRIPKNFVGCTFNISFSECPPFVMKYPNETRFGVELKILDALAEHLQFKFHQKPYSLEFYYAGIQSDGSYAGLFKLLSDGEIDIAGSCVTVDLHARDFNVLPSHIQDIITWFLPGPIPKSIAFGFITALPTELWLALGAFFIIVFCFVLIITPAQRIGYSFIWTVARFLALPNSDLGKTFVFRSFSLSVDIAILIFTTIYRSLILLQLYKAPVLILSTALQGIHYGLTPFIRPRDVPNINQTDHDFWNEIGKCEIDFNSPYDLLIYNKSIMMIGSKLIDQAVIRLFFPNVIYKTAVTVQKEAFMPLPMAFTLPPHYPLTEIFSVAVLNIVQSGLPEFYLEETLRNLPGSGEDHLDEDLKPLSLANLLTVFYLLLLLLAIALIVLLLEILNHYCFKLKKNPVFRVK